MKTTFIIQTFFLLMVFNHQVGAQDSSQIYKPLIQFVGTGDIQQSLAEGTEIPASSGLGVTLEKVYKNPLWHLIRKFELETSINIASTADTIHATRMPGDTAVANIREFGNSILLPLNSGQAAYINFKTSFTDKDSGVRIFSGFQGRFIGSNRNWQDTITERSGSMSLRLGFFHEFIPSEYTDKYSISLSVNYSMRAIFGDASQLAQKEFRKKILQTDKTTFYGWDISLSIRLRNIIAEVSMTQLFGQDEIPGLSQTQFFTAIRFTGGFPLSLN